MAICLDASDTEAVLATASNLSWARNVYEEGYVAEQCYGVDGIFVGLPFFFQTSKIRASISGFNGVVRTDFGLMLAYDWNSIVVVTLPGTYSGSVCGLCGNFNGKAGDDLTLSDGSITSNAVTFGNQWKVADVPGCTAECTGTCPFCTDAQAQPYKLDDYCGIIVKTTGPFSRCQATIDPLPFFTDCVFDTCLYMGHQIALCDAITAYVSACQAAGIQILDWRQVTFCGRERGGVPVAITDTDTTSEDELAGVAKILDKKFEEVRSCGRDPDDADEENDSGTDEEPQAVEEMEDPTPQPSLPSQPVPVPQDNSGAISMAIQALSPVCPQNSHYELCGVGCPTTCYNPASTANCSLPCREGCYCDSGFVLSGEECIALKDCGCVYKELYYKQGQSFYSDILCQERCQCGISGAVTCQKATCGVNTECKVVDGVQRCHPVGYGICRAYGDPHYTTFDGQHFNFMGTCVYQLVGVTPGNPSLVPFNVTVQNNNRGNKAVSYTKMVNVEVYGLTLSMSKDAPRKIKVDDIFMSLPFYFQTSKIVAFRSGINGIIKTDFGLVVVFDWDSIFSVTLPSTYIGAVFGLCGNYNQRINDDLTTKGGILVTSAVQFGDSWKVRDIPGCSPQCVGNCPVCNDADKKKYVGNNFCGIINSPNGPFSACFTTIDPTPFFEDCVFDTCQYNGLSSVLCDSITVYASACQAKGIQIQAWRTGSFCRGISWHYPTNYQTVDTANVKCPPSPDECGPYLVCATETALACPDNSHYEQCGVSCPSTCYSFSPPVVCSLPCSEGCYCDSGFIQSGDECAPIKGCGCVYKGRYYKQTEEFFVDKLCQQKCKCQANGIVTCQIIAPCGPKTECKVVDGIQGCFPVPSVTTPGTCVGSGDPHYTTFDGFKFDFMGTCIYQLAGLCSNDSTLTPFNVKVLNNNRGNSAVSYTKTVTLEVYNLKITLSKDAPFKMQTNYITGAAKLIGRTLVQQLITSLPLEESLSNFVYGQL
ncbi:IgGFc-binding protein-like [Ambystoma mexicanum]|uniref:IgGFc-binding protein-like n=1 Tax=Ambystoma mexicanum TaxID=8296 RepID=UPI0037E87D54